MQFAVHNQKLGRLKNLGHSNEMHGGPVRPKEEKGKRVRNIFEIGNEKCFPTQGCAPLDLRKLRIQSSNITHTTFNDIIGTHLDLILSNPLLALLTLHISRKNNFLNLFSANEPKHHTQSHDQSQN